MLFVPWPSSSWVAKMRLFPVASMANAQKPIDGGLVQMPHSRIAADVPGPPVVPVVLQDGLIQKRSAALVVDVGHASCFDIPVAGEGCGRAALSWGFAGRIQTLASEPASVRRAVIGSVVASGRRPFSIARFSFSNVHRPNLTDFALVSMIGFVPSATSTASLRPS